MPKPGPAPLKKLQRAPAAKRVPQKGARSKRSTALHQRFDVFLAHNKSDERDVELIASELRRRRISPWLSKEQMLPGSWVLNEILRALPLVDSAAVFIGTAGLGLYQAFELRSFIKECLERDMRVIPVLLPKVKAFPKELTFLEQLSWVEFGNTLSTPTAFDALEWGITGRRPSAR